jgi:transcription antitermination factor NusG
LDSSDVPAAVKGAIHMKTRVLLRQVQKGVAAGSVVAQPHLYPGDLFSQPSRPAGIRWTCVRTRPRWEKKFAGWLRDHGQTYFLPVFPHETLTGRKRRVSELPLFPGFVFVAGAWTKKDFASTGSVAYVLAPRGEAEAQQLHAELKNVWRGLTSGMYVTPVRNLAAGEPCRIMRGPLQGVEAKFERIGHNGRLILQVEMMGGGIVVEASADGVEVGF